MNAVAFCKLVESTLGWQAPSGPEWKRYNVTAALVKKKIATNPSLYTWRNLQLAVELLRREKKARTPLGVFAHVERAIAKAVDEDMDTEVAIREVVAYEAERGDPQGWVVRFARATGVHRAEALREWQQAVK